MEGKREVMRRMFQTLGTSDSKFVEDSRWVEQDLQSLKRVVELQSRSSNE